MPRKTNRSDDVSCTGEVAAAIATPATQSDKAEFDDKSLLGTFVTFSRRINEQLDKIKDAIDTLGRAAAIASKIGSQDDRRQALEAAERLIEEHRELKFVLDALVYLASKGNARAYRMSSDTTDFQALIEDTVVQLKAEERRPFKIEEHPLMKVFMSNAAGEDVIEQIDDDIQVETRTTNFKNAKCPLSLRDLVDLKEPVEDSHGFVYEREDLMRYMSQTRPDGRGRYPCPEAASGTTFTKEEIKPAEAVLRLRQRKGRV